MSTEDLVDLVGYLVFAISAPSVIAATTILLVALRRREVQIPFLISTHSSVLRKKYSRLPVQEKTRFLDWVSRSLLLAWILVLVAAGLILNSEAIARAIAR